MNPLIPQELANFISAVLGILFGGNDQRVLCS